MKIIRLLVISDCGQCKHCSINQDIAYCHDAGKKIENKQQIPDWCPLEIDEIESLYKNICLEKDENLTEDAKQLKYEILEYINKFKQLSNS